MPGVCHPAPKAYREYVDPGVDTALVDTGVVGELNDQPVEVKIGSVHAGLPMHAPGAWRRIEDGKELPAPSNHNLMPSIQQAVLDTSNSGGTAAHKRYKLLSAAPIGSLERTLGQTAGCGADRRASAATS
eukprot:CAMPEP_0176175964 /NCGR_PEP_ID=MMETSP0120_2-20121206/90140_1 /TAXON_ID=160619 /ORGANISM="Kryptoperidinium foliaceum, Strain CCMP 1326" /LENGTH=129 /DNA_ID=CAMNT_0017514013 /DNA_START=160 /DNA_END=548 /DNA_ORIENTATION=-